MQSSAPASIAASSMVSASATSAAKRISPTRSNWKLTLLLSPSEPPYLVKAARTSLAVRLRLSVSASTITAAPPGP